MDRGTSLISEKLFSRSSFHDITYFPILASGPHLDVIITSENIFRSSRVDVIIYNCGPLITIFLVLEDFLSRCRIHCGFLSDGSQ